MSLAVVSAEAAPVYSLPSTVESDSQLLAERASPRASQVGHLALVSESTAPYKSSKELNAARIIDRERQQREQILHGVVGSLASIVAEMKSKAVTSRPSPSHIVRLPTRCIISTSAASTAAIVATVLIKIS